MKLANALATTIISILGVVMLVTVLAYGAALIWFQGDIDAVWDTVWVYKVENTDTSISREMESLRRKGIDAKAD